MRATAIPVSEPQPHDLGAASMMAHQQLSYILHRLMHRDTPTAEKANLYGRRETLEHALEWFDGVLAMELADWERVIHLRTLLTFLLAYRDAAHKHAKEEEKRNVFSLEWRNLTTGRLQGYDYCINLLKALGVKPIR